jgi:hypothetical protein
LASICKINASSEAGTSRLSSRGGCGAALACWCMIATGRSAMNGGLPVSIS